MNTASAFWVHPQVDEVAFKMYDSTTGNSKLSGEVLKRVITVASEEGNRLIYLLYALLYGLSSS